MDQEESQLASIAIDGSNINVRDVISKLRFISKIEKDEKLVTNNKSNPYVIADTNLNKILRTCGISPGSKEDTLDFIKNTIEKGLELAKICLASNNPFHQNIARLIIESIDHADSGIQNVMYTYSKKPKYRLFVAEVETFRQILDAKLKSINGDPIER